MYCSFQGGVLHLYCERCREIGSGLFGKHSAMAAMFSFFPRMKTMNAKRFLIGQVSKPITTLHLFVGRYTVRIAHDAELAINKYGGFVVPVYAKFLERIFPSRTPGKIKAEVEYFIYFSALQVCCKC